MADMHPRRGASRLPSLIRLSQGSPVFPQAGNLPPFPNNTDQFLRADHQQVTKGSPSDQTLKMQAIKPREYLAICCQERKVLPEHERKWGYFVFLPLSSLMGTFPAISLLTCMTSQALEFLYWVMQIPSLCYAIEVKKWGEFSSKNVWERETRQLH